MCELDKIVKQVMENPFNYEWELQGFGMLRTYIDKNTRLQIWLKEFIVPNITDVHTHPWDFESFIYQGQITNHCWRESSKLDGVSFDRCLILTGEKAYVKERTQVILKVIGNQKYTRGMVYSHEKNIPHRIDFVDGTITILTKSNIREDSLAYSYVMGIGNEWVSAAPRLATKNEIKKFIDAASKLNKETTPTIQDMFKQYTDVMNTFMVDEESGEKEFHKLIDTFNEKYKIVPKEDV